MAPSFYIHPYTYVRVISPSFRNIRWRGKVVEDETYLAGSVNSPSCLPQLRARRMCFQHTIVNTFYLFVYTKLLLSVYRWNRAVPDPLSIGHSSRWRASKGLWELKANNTRSDRKLMFITQTRWENVSPRYNLKLQYLLFFVSWLLISVLIFFLN